MSIFIIIIDIIRCQFGPRTSPPLSLSMDGWRRWKRPRADSEDASDVAQHGSDGDSEDDGDVTVTLLDLAGNDMFPGVAIQVNRDASLGQLQRRVMDATGVVSPWFQGKHLVVGHWVHPFDDAYCYFMRIPQVRKQVGANRLQARVVRTLAACTD